MPKWVEFESPSIFTFDAYIEIDSSDIIYIKKCQHNVWVVIYFPLHGSSKIMYKGIGKAKAREWLDKFLKKEEQKDREKSWKDNKGNTRMDVEESKIAEEREG